MKTNLTTNRLTNVLTQMTTDQPASSACQEYVNAMNGTRGQLGLDPLEFPCTTGQVFDALAALGYAIDHNRLHNLFSQCALARPSKDPTTGNLQWDPESFRALHCQLELRRFWAPFPNAFHDGRKTVLELSEEVATAVAYADHPEELIDKLTPRLILRLLAASITPTTQNLLLAIAAKKFGIDPGEPEFDAEWN